MLEQLRQAVSQHADAETQGVRLELPARHLLHPQADLHFLVPILTLPPPVVFPNHFRRSFFPIRRHRVIAVPVNYLLAVVGGAALASALGYLASRVTAAMDDPQVEITLTTILAYGSYLLAYNLHLSGVIAAASAGLVLANFGAKEGMSEKTRTAMQSFREYVSFVMNSLVFLLIGLEIHVRELLQNWTSWLLAIGSVLVGRALSVYLLIPVSNRFAMKIPLRRQHVAVWGGLRGALALALALSINSGFPYREQILTLTFSVVTFSILAQGLTIKPILRALRLADGHTPTACSPAAGKR